LTHPTQTLVDPLFADPMLADATIHTTIAVLARELGHTLSMGDPVPANAATVVAQIRALIPRLEIDYAGHILFLAAATVAQQAVDSGNTESLMDIMAALSIEANARAAEHTVRPDGATLH